MGLARDISKIVSSNTTLANTYEKLIPYSSSAPSNPVEGDLWVDSTVPTIKSYIGGQWILIGGGAPDSDQSILPNRIFG